MNSENRILHPISETQPYYVTRVRRTLEVRVEATHEVVDVIEPPAEWGDKWLWSYIGFDGVRCVPIDAISLIRLDAPPLIVTNTNAGEHLPLSDMESFGLDDVLPAQLSPTPPPSHLPHRRTNSAFSPR